MALQVQAAAGHVPALSTLSQLNHAINGLHWPYQNRRPVDGLERAQEPEILRSFHDRPTPESNWIDALVTKVPRGIRRECVTCGGADVGRLR